MLNKFAVHLYTQVHVKVTGIQAETMEQAMEKAESAVDLHDVLDNKSLRVSKYDLGGGVKVECAEWAEGRPDSILVDPLLENGEVDYEATRWFGPDGLPLIDGDNTVERKAKRTDLAVKFMQELLDSVETLTGIAEEHGAGVLADLMYLQQAILKDGYIDQKPDETAVMAIVSELPSASTWKTFIKVEQPEPLFAI